ELTERLGGGTRQQRSLDGGSAPAAVVDDELAPAGIGPTGEHDAPLERRDAERGADAALMARAQARRDDPAHIGEHLDRDGLASERLLIDVEGDAPARLQHEFGPVP